MWGYSPASEATGCAPTFWCSLRETSASWDRADDPSRDNPGVYYYYLSPPSDALPVVKVGLASYLDGHFAMMPSGSI